MSGPQAVNSNEKATRYERMAFTHILYNNTLRNYFLVRL